MWKSWSFGLVAAIAGASVTAGTAQADPVAEFYRDKGLKIIAAAGAGGGFGIRARLLEQFLPRHMPGSPSIVVDFMPGAGGRRAADFIYNVAPKDGSAFGILFHNTAWNVVLQPEGARFDPTKFTYLGSQSPAMITIYAWHKAPATTLEQMRGREIFFGSQSATSAGTLNAFAANAIAGTNFNVVLGYQGTADYLKAMESGEVHAALADWDSIVSVRTEWVRDGILKPVLQHTLARHPDLPDVPRLIDLATNEEHRRLAEFDALPTAIGHTNVAPPGIPRERAEALRKALADTYRDPDFIARSNGLFMAVAPVSAEEVEKYVERIMSFPPELLVKAREIYRLN